MAFDTAGPFKEGKDLDKKKKKYLLVAAYTWPVLRATNGDAEDPDTPLRWWPITKVRWTWTRMRRQPL